jgi:hypothetical protein
MPYGRECPAAGVQVREPRRKLLPVATSRSSRAGMSGEVLTGAAPADPSGHEAIGHEPPSVA